MLLAAEAGACQQVAQRLEWRVRADFFLLLVWRASRARDLWGFSRLTQTSLESCEEPLMVHPQLLGRLSVRGETGF